MVLGSGLIGTSIGLALRRQAVAVYLCDTNRENLEVAVAMGAGEVGSFLDDPAAVVVAVPPAQLGSTIASALARWPTVTVTDVGSVKEAPLRHAAETGAALDRYVGSHPMAGSERSGPSAAAADLFDGQAWAIVPHEQSRPGSVETVASLARACGAEPVRMSARQHDDAVARTSHLPYLMAVLTAARLQEASTSDLALRGSGLRDTTRLAASDPTLWNQILSLNAAPLAALLAEVQSDIEDVLADLRLLGSPIEPAMSEPQPDSALSTLLCRGTQGRQNIVG